MRRWSSSNLAAQLFSHSTKSHVVQPDSTCSGTPRSIIRLHPYGLLSFPFCSVPPPPCLSTWSRWKSCCLFSTTCLLYCVELSPRWDDDDGPVWDPPFWLIGNESESFPFGCNSAPLRQSIKKIPLPLPTPNSQLPSIFLRIFIGSGRCIALWVIKSLASNTGNRSR